MNNDIIDFTFLMLVRAETIERLENILNIVKYISKNMPYKINVLECSGYCNGILKDLLGEEIEYTFIEDNDPILHLTRYRNVLAKSVKTKYIGIWDSDAIVSAKQFNEALGLLESDKADFVYPYDKQLLDTSSIMQKLFLENGDIEILEKNKNKMKEMYSPNPVGGGFMAKKNAFIEAGMENEDYYGWGLEDGERYYRWLNKGYRVKRVSGPMFHLTHGRGINSTFHNPDQKFIKEKEILAEVRNKSTN